MTEPTRFKPKLPSLNGDSFRVEFKSPDGEVEAAWLDQLNQTVQAVNLRLDHFFGEDPMNGHIEYTTMGFVHKLVAQADFVKKFFDRLNEGVKLDVELILCAGSQRELELYRFKYPGTRLQLAGELKLGTSQEVLVSTIGIFTRQVTNLVRQQLSDGSTHYKYDSNHAS